MADRVWIWFAENGHIRKWDSKPFAEGIEYVASLSPEQPEKPEVVETGELPDDMRCPLHSLRADMDYLVARIRKADDEEAGLLKYSIQSRLSQIEEAAYRMNGKLRCSLTTLRQGMTLEFSNARRMRAAVVEARRRLAKARSTWNGPCHECDGVLRDALSAFNDTAHSPDQAQPEAVETGEPVAMPFERFPALRDHILRMATTGRTGSVFEWSDFLGELNAAVASPVSDGEARRKVLTEAAAVAEAHFDDRGNARSGHPSCMDWTDGFQDATRGVARVLRALAAIPTAGDANNGQ